MKISLVYFSKSPVAQSSTPASETKKGDGEKRGNMENEKEVSQDV